MKNVIFIADFYFEKKRNKNKLIFKYQPQWSMIYYKLNFEKIFEYSYDFPIYIFYEKEFEQHIIRILVKSSKIGNFDVAVCEFKKSELKLINDIETLKKEIYKKIL